MISKITVFYFDNTFDDVDPTYWPRLSGEYSKRVKEVIIYFDTGSYQKMVPAANEVSVPVVDPSKVKPFLVPNDGEIDKHGWPKKYEPYRMYPRLTRMALGANEPWS